MTQHLVPSANDEIQMISDYIKNWAADNKAVFEDHGEVGFGRSCVGITVGTHYIDLQHLDGDYRTLPDSADWPLVCAPAECEDAYHKADCLAVLVHDENYDIAIRQLYFWIRKLEENNIGITSYQRTPSNAFDLALHGMTTTCLVVKS